MQSASQAVSLSLAFPPPAFRPATARRRILDAARTLLLKHGYERFTMDAVAHRSGLTRRTLYNQFEDRDALYRASRMELLEAFEDRLPRELPPVGDVQAMVEVFFTRALAALATSEHRELLQSVQRDGAVAPWLNTLYAARVERPLRLAVEHFLLTQKVRGSLEIGDPGPAAMRCLAMLRAAVTASDAAPVFDAAELAALFAARIAPSPRVAAHERL